MKKKTIIKLAAIIAVAALVGGFTLAYLTATTGTKANTFTVSDNIAIQLAEPNFDNIPFTGETAPYTSDQDPALGVNKAKNIVPGREIPKNPSVKNTSDIEKVWVAIKLDYKLGDTLAASNYAAIDQFATINWINAGSATPLTEGWIAKDDSKTVFYYSIPVEPSNKTKELFDKVTIDNVAYGALHKFAIDITAYAVQEEGLDYTGAKTELDKLINPTP